jgi:hypothetical protein
MKDITFEDTVSHPNAESR